VLGEESKRARACPRCDSTFSQSQQARSARAYGAREAQGPPCTRCTKVVPPPALNQRRARGGGGAGGGLWRKHRRRVWLRRRCESKARWRRGAASEVGGGGGWRGGKRPTEREGGMPSGLRGGEGRGRCWGIGEGIAEWQGLPQPHRPAAGGVLQRPRLLHVGERGKSAPPCQPVVLKCGADPPPALPCPPTPPPLHTHSGDHGTASLSATVRRSGASR